MGSAACGLAGSSTTRCTTTFAGSSTLLALAVVVFVGAGRGGGASALLLLAVVVLRPCLAMNRIMHVWPDAANRSIVQHIPMQGPPQKVTISDQRFTSG
jgi:hypothetical protein